MANANMLTVKKNQYEFVICETDVDMALDHLATDPEAYPNKINRSLARARFIADIKLYTVDKIGRKAKVGDCYEVGYDMWAHIGYVGADLMGYPHEFKRYQIYISVRSASTDASRLTSLNQCAALDA